MYDTDERKPQLVLLQDKRKARSTRKQSKSSQMSREAITNGTYQPASWYSERLKSLSAVHEVIGNSTDEIPADDSRSAWAKSPELCYTVLDTLYDPFLQSGGLTQRQLYFNHLYMRDLAPMTFGMPQDAKFAPAKHMTQLCLQHSVAGAQWTAVVAEEIICAFSGQPRTAEMALERTAANKALELALRDYRTNFQVAYLAVIKATLACPWLGDTKKRNVFGLAADLLIQCVGGVRKALALTPVLEPIHIAAPSLWANAPRISQRALDQTTSRFLNSVQQILLMDRLGCRGPFGNRITDVLEVQALPNGYQALEEQIRQSFDCYAAPEDDHSTMYLKFRLSLLIELCWVFAAAIGDPDLVLAQLQYLEQQCRNDPVARMTKKERLMRVHQMANVVSHMRREVLATCGPSRRIECDFLVCQMEIDGYKIFDYETTSTRQQVLARLYAWFKQDIDGAQPFTANEIDVLKEEIRVSWCIQHGKPVDRRNSLRPK